MQTTNFKLLLLLCFSFSCNALFSQLNTSCAIDSIPEGNEVSGLAYYPDLSRLYALSNGNTDALRYLNIIELNGTSNPTTSSTTIDLVGFTDPEGICRLSGNLFAIANEATNTIYRVGIPAPGGSITAANPVVVDLEIIDDNKSIEGITYSSPDDRLYFVVEGLIDDDEVIITPTLNYIPKFGTSNGLTDHTVVTTNPDDFCTSYDFSGLSILPNGNLLVASDECSTLYELSVDANNVATLVTSYPLGMSQVEGVTVISENEVWVAGETESETENELLLLYVENVTPCDDGDFSTENDVYLDNCLCQGVDNTCVENVDGTVEGFEDDLGIWNQSSDDDIDWLFNTGSTPTGGTGPSGAFEGNQYIYLEASFGNTLKNGIIVSDCFEISGVDGYEIDFHYHMNSNFSTPSLTFDASTDGGSNWTNLWTISGDQGDQWHAVNLDLSSYIDTEVIYRISGTTGANISSDIALDAISFNSNETCDTAGQACDDGNPCTINDTYDDSVDCNCVGISIGLDDDGDGICAGDDPDDNNPCVPDSNNGACTDCSVIYVSDFESGLQGWTDGGAWCVRVNAPTRSSSGNYSVRLRGYGASSNLTLGYSLPNTQDLEISFSMYALRMEVGDNLLVQLATNGTTDYETVANFVRGEDFDNNSFSEHSVHLNGPFPLSTHIRFQLDANQAGDWVYLDDIELRSCTVEAGPTCSDGILNGTEKFIDCGGFGCAPCPCELDELPVETCTTIYDPVCGCDGNTYDNACIAETQAGISEYSAGPCSTCDDGIMNGQETTVDCGGPDCGNCNDACDTPTIFGFEYGLDGWIDGGSDCLLVYDKGFGSDYSVRLRDNSSTSTLTSPTFNLGTDLTIVSFTYFVESFEGVEDFFLENSADGGATWNVIGNYRRGTDFNNNERKFVTEELYALGDSKFRFRCDASGNADLLYIDNVSIQSCSLTYAPNKGGQESEARSATAKMVKEMQIYPNPVSMDNELIISLGAPSEKNTIQVFDMEGKLILQQNNSEKQQQFKLPLQGIQNGTYLLRVIEQNGIQVKKFIVLE